MICHPVIDKDGAVIVKEDPDENDLFFELFGNSDEEEHNSNGFCFSKSNLNHCTIDTRTSNKTTTTTTNNSTISDTDCFNISSLNNCTITNNKNTTSNTRNNTNNNSNNLNSTKDDVESRRKYHCDIPDSKTSVQEDILGFSVYNSLSKTGICVIDNFLKEDAANKLYLAVKHLSSLQGLLYDPQVNSTATFGDRFRDDYITWISGEEHGCDSIKTLNKSIHDILRYFLRYSRNQNKQLEITHRSTTQLSCFPTGSMGYKIHSDNSENNGRLLSVVYHCNAGYKQENYGGATRFYVRNKYVDVAAKYNRLVIYFSNSLLLEMLPCKKTLYSLTSWYFGELMANLQNHPVMSEL